MKSLSMLGLGLSLLTGCDQLWKASLGCANGSALTTDVAGNSSCPGDDMATGGITAWPATPVPIAPTHTELISGLRILSFSPGVTQPTLNIFYNNKTSYDTASASCDGKIVIQSASSLPGIVYDANSALVNNKIFYYTVSQNHDFPTKMDVTDYTIAANPVVLGSGDGVTKPGLSYVEPISLNNIYMLIARTDSGAFDIGKGTTGGTVSVGAQLISQQTGYFIDQTVRADFNGDKINDYVVSLYDGHGSGLISACMSNISATTIPCVPLSRPFESTGDLLANGEFPGQPRVIRVTRGSSAQVGVSSITMDAANQGTYLLSAPAWIPLPTGFTTSFVVARNLDNGVGVSVYIAGTRIAVGTTSASASSVIALKVDKDGALLNTKPVEFPLEGPPTAMVGGNFPCNLRGQLVIAQTVGGVSVIRAYELPTL